MRDPSPIGATRPRRDVKFFFDENMPVVAVRPLIAMFGDRHEFETAQSLGLQGADDIELYPRVRTAGALLIISKDDRQLKNPTERRGLYDNGLSFIHLRMGRVSGRKGLALTVTSLTAGIPYVEERWTPEPHAFRLRGLQSGFTERVSSYLPLWQERWGARPELTDQ